MAWPAGDPYRTALRAEEQGQADLIRCIFGPLLFRRKTIDLSLLRWNDGLVVKLAEAAYDERILPEGTLDPTRLAVLSDAVEEAGSTDPEMLNHLRGRGYRVRGNWAVDLLLGKT